MHFPEVMTREWAQRLVSPSRVVTKGDRPQNRRWERHLGIAEMGEHAMATWRQQFLQDVLDERPFFVQRKAKRMAERSAYREDMRTWKQAALFNTELKEAPTWSSDDERWADTFIMMEESKTSASEEDDEE
ncbi:Ethylene-responsive transcription factor CRF1 [Hordeum vulgare]|nr:Ethylene-responsive transcription factor CRF1 [Hordeum vulgare]